MRIFCIAASVAVFFLFFVGCSGDKSLKQGYTYNAVDYVFTPLVLHPGENIIFTKTYFSDVTLVDSIRFSQAGFAEISSDLRKIVITPDFEQLRQLTEIVFYVDGHPYSLLCKKAAMVKTTFSVDVSRDLNYNKVYLAGDFNEWRSKNTPLTFEGHRWAAYLFLEPGEYAYRIVGDDKNIFLANVRDSVHSADGGYNYIKKVRDKFTKTPVISLKSVSNGKLQIVSNQEISEYFFYWENMRIPVKLSQLDEENYYLEIPESARAVKNSLIRVYAFNRNGISNDLIIPLIQGEIQPGSGKYSKFDQATMALLLPDNNYSEQAEQLISSGFFENTGITAVLHSNLNSFTDAAFIGSGQLPQHPHARVLGFDRSENLSDAIKLFDAPQTTFAMFDSKLFADSYLTFNDDSVSFELLAESLRYSMRSYGYNHLLGNLLPDVLKSNAGSELNDLPEEQLKMLQLFALNISLPGVPCMMSSHSSLEALQTFDETAASNKSLVSVVMKLLELRRNNMSVVFGDFKILEATRYGFIYQRKFLDDVVIVAFNKSSFRQMMGVNLSDIPVHTQFKSHFGHLNKQSELYVRFDLPPHSFEVLTSVKNQ